MADIKLEQLLHTAGDNPVGTTNGALDVHVTASSGLATDTKLEQARALLAVLAGVDYATDAGQANIAAAIAGLSGKAATDAKLELVRLLLADLEGKDFATQDTLAAVLGKLSDDPATQTTLAAVLAKLSGDPSTATKQDAAKAVLDAIALSTAAGATAAKQDAVKAVLDTIAASVATAATQATLAAIQAALTDGTQKVQLSGSLVDLRGLAANKPLATAVAVGATYWSVDTDPHGNAIEISNGMQWVVI